MLPLWPLNETLFKRKLYSNTSSVIKSKIENVADRWRLDQVRASIEETQ